jgi:phage/plasmid-like protein (TIGR03299 family)
MFESGMFVRQPAWHGLGNVLDYVPNPLEAFESSGLNWRVNKCPLFADTPDERRVKTPYYGIVRDSDDAVLGTAKGRWVCYQNEDAFAWTVPLVESGKWEFETAGSLKGGERCWALLKQNEVEIVPKDILRQYLMVCWSHDGMTSNFIQPTSVRVVCNNTLNMALREEGVSRMAVRHSQFVVMKMDAIRELYLETAAQFDSQVQAFRKLAKKKLSKAKIEAVLDELFPIGETEGKALTYAANRRELVEDAVIHGSGIQEHKLEGTAYGVLMGVTEAVEHFLGGNKITDRGENIMWRQGRVLSDKAFELLAAA